MNDSEIIKALECCMKAECQNCPMYIKENQSCKGIQIFDVVVLINRQQAEIEKLKKLVVEKHTEINRLDKYMQYVRNETIKEFTEKLKKFAVTERVRINQRRHVDVSYVRVYDIDR